MGAAARRAARKRREELLRSFPEERRKKVLKLRAMIRQGKYDLEGKFEAIFDELLDDVTR